MPLKKALSAGGGGPRANSAGSDFVPRVPVFGDADPAGEICLFSHLKMKIMTVSSPGDARLSALNKKRGRPSGSPNKKRYVNPNAEEEEIVRNIAQHLLSFSMTYNICCLSL